MALPLRQTDMKGIQLENCEVTGVASRKDGSVRVSFETAELRPSEKGSVMDFHGKACCVAILPHKDAEAELIVVKTEKGTRSPSQRLHSALFVLWKQGGEQGDFDSWYKRRMEEIIDGIKAKLQ